MMFHRLMTIVACIFGVVSCGGRDTGNDQNFLQQNNTLGVWQEGVFKPSSDFSDRCASILDQNNWLRSVTHELYFWYDEVIDQDPAGFDDPLTYFDTLKTSQRTSTGRPKDRFHSTLPTDVWLNSSEQGISVGYGISFEIRSTTPPREVLIALTEPGSPAAVAGLKRGDRILSVDGAGVSNSNDVDTLNAGFFPSASGEIHGFVVENFEGEDRREITLESGEITLSAVPQVELINTASGNVGYLLFNDHNLPSEQQLIDAIVGFDNVGITDLVLDLRYNGGGFLFIANQLAYMIAGTPSIGDIFSRTVFSDKHRFRDPVTGEVLQPQRIETRDTMGRDLPTLNLAKVYVLTGNSTCSASEALINGLTGIGIDIIQIGTSTCGKPYGFYGLSNCDTTYFTVQFQVQNALGFGDYGDGFTPQNSPIQTSATLPGCNVADDLSRPLGKPEEARLAAAMEYRRSGTCPPNQVSTTKTQQVSSMEKSGRPIHDPNAWRRSMLILNRAP